MNWISKKVTGKCYSYEKLYYGDAETSTCYYQSFYEVTYFLCFPIYRKFLFREDVPNFAIHERAIFGMTYWKSKRPDLVDLANQKSF